MRSVLISTFLILLPAIARAQKPINVTVEPDFNASRVTIPEDFTGVSYEITLLLPNEDGKYYFGPDNKPLINMFKALGIHNLRVGGNSADKPGAKIPMGTDIDTFFAFAKAADVKVIYTLRLREQASPDADVAVAKYLWDHYKSQISYLTIGNEPNVYLKEYPAYRDQLVKFINAIVAVAPDARFCGPSSTPSKVAWARDLANDLGDNPNFRFLTQHSYPGGSAKKVVDATSRPDPAHGRDLMLSPEWVAGYQKFHDTFVPAALDHHLLYRLEETNSFFNGGLADASNTFASSLWGLDYMYWWAEHGCEGLNFHTGDRVASGDNSVPCQYAVFVTDNDSYAARPLGYAIKAFDVAAHGSIVPVKITSIDKINLTAYSVLSTDQKTLYVTLINKTHNENARDATVSLNVGGSWKDPQRLDLLGVKQDVASTTVTLGGEFISDSGDWNGKWQPGSNPSALPVSAASAVIIKFTAN